jgi:hypothetical protein
MEIDCCPECFVFTVFIGSELGVRGFRGCFTMAASAEEVRKYGAASGNGDTQRERTITLS